uniref:Uncharacterized protein n=1 Tax=Arundo donax TaxID=35708 RepID=A0A0A9HU54_ARUDO
MILNTSPTTRIDNIADPAKHNNVLMLTSHHLRFYMFVYTAFVLVQDRLSNFTTTIEEIRQEKPPYFTVLTHARNGKRNQ